jgi:hypothetical protein
MARIGYNSIEGTHPDYGGCDSVLVDVVQGFPVPLLMFYLEKGLKSPPMITQQSIMPEYLQRRNNRPVTSGPT